MHLSRDNRRNIQSSRNEFDTSRNRSDLVQFKNQVAGSPVVQQKEMLQPPRPVMMVQQSPQPAGLAAPVQRDEEGDVCAPAQVGSCGNVISADPSGVEINAPVVRVNAAMVELNSSMVNTTGVLRADTIQATNVIGANYTPGAGNVW